MVQHVLSKADNNGLIDVADGDVIVIELPELATAGYSWQAERVPEGVDVSVRPVAPLSTAIGATARTKIVATVRAARGGDIVLRHRQPWSPEEGDEAFRVTTRVKK